MGKCPLQVKMFGLGPGNCRPDCGLLVNMPGGAQRCALAFIGELAAEKLEEIYREEVMAGSNKVVIDVSKGNNLMYLPLDRVISRNPRVVENDVISGTNSGAPSSRTSDTESRLRDRLRSREVR